MNENKYLDHLWISGRDTIGVVLIKNSIGEISARIGIAPRAPRMRDNLLLFSYDKLDEIADIQHIADWGSKLSFKQAKGFFPYI